MNGRLFRYVFIVVLLLALFSGCALGQTVVPDFGPNPDAGILSDDMTMEEVKEFLLTAHGIIGDVALAATPTDGVLASRPSSDIVACSGDYSSFNSVIKAVGTYFASPEIVEKELYTVNLFNINGRIGMATAGGGDRYAVCLESTVSIITSDSFRKELQVEAYNASGETAPLTYILEKIDGAWRISDIYGWPDSV